MLSSGLLWVGGKFIKDTLLPKYLEFRYDGIDISGVWEGRIDSPSGANSVYWLISLELNQAATKLTGHYSAAQYVSETKKSTTIAKVEGELWEGHIRLSCKTSNRKKPSFGVMLLRYAGEGPGGPRIKGIQSFRQLGTAKNEIMTLELTLFQFRTNEDRQLALAL